MRIRRSGAVLLSSGLLCLGGAAIPLVSAHADAELGSGLGSFALSANAPVMQVRFDYAAQQCSATTAGTAGCEGVVNESVSQLSNGPVGYALSSVAWPGTLAGNLGNLLIVASGGQVPDQAKALNSPIRAEAHTGGTPVVTDYPPAPAPVLAHMKADAQDSKVTAEAVLGGLQQPTIGSLGASTSRTLTQLTGVSSAVATAHSEVQDITIAGVLHLGAVESDASATTDGTTAKPTGRTVVTGASVDGIPVSIDQNGITVDTQNAAIPSVAVDTVNTALKSAGITIALSKPHGTPNGASVDYDAGVLSVVWKMQDGMILSAELGGAQVSVTSTPGYSFTTPNPPPLAGGTTGGTTGGAVAPPTGLSGATTGGPIGTGVVPPPTVGQPGPFTPQTAAESGPFPHGINPWFGALGVIGAGLVMAGLRRLPDRVLVASASSCPNGAIQ